MIDIHSHILPNVDDGSRSFDESIQIIDEAIKCGFDKIISTSHYIQDSFEINEIDRLKKIKKLKKANKNIEIFIGSEIYATDNINQLLDDKKASSLNNSRYVLFEIPFYNNVSFFDKMIDDLKRNNYLPIIAHPERYEIVKNNPKIVERWKKRGIYIQSNFNSINGVYGNKSKEIVKLLLKHKLIDFLGSDVHRVGTYKDIKNSIKKLKKITGENYFKEITELNQLKVINNEKIEITDQREIKKKFLGKYE